MEFDHAGRYGPHTLLTGAGVPRANTAVTVLTTSGPAAAVYADRDRAAAANPVVTDAAGNLVFYADPGLVDLSVAGVPGLLRVEVPVDPEDAIRQGSAGPVLPRRRIPAPPGVKLKGGNLVPHPDDTNSWVNVWGRWTTDNRFAGWVVPQLELAAGVGMNAVRFIGGAGGVLTGAYTLATYLDRLEQYVEAAGDLGLYVYGVGGDFGQMFPALPAQSERAAWIAGPVADVLAATAATLDRYSHVVGMDIVQESLRGEGIWRPGATEAEQHEFNAVLAAAVRAETRLPVTFSHPVGPVVGDPGTTGSSPPEPPNSPQVFNPPYLSDWQAAANYGDYLDIHDFYDIGLDDPTEVFKLGLPIIVGECGSAQSAGEPVRVARLHAMGRFLSRPDVYGGFVWSIVDQKLDPEEQFGLHDSAFTPRTASIFAISGWPTADVPMVLPLVGSDTFLDQALGESKPMTGSGAQLTLGRHCNVVASLTFDYDAPAAADVAGGYVGLSENGEAWQNLSAEGVLALNPFGNGTLPPGSVPFRSTTHYQASRLLTAGSVWDFDIRAIRAAGPSVNGVVNAPNTNAVLTIYGL